MKDNRKEIIKLFELKEKYAYGDPVRQCIDKHAAKLGYFKLLCDDTKHEFWCLCVTEKLFDCKNCDGLQKFNAWLNDDNKEE